MKNFLSQNKGIKTKVISLFIIITTIIIAVMIKNAYASYGVARAAGEHNVSRSVMINLNGGTTSGAGWMATIDRTGNGYTAGNGWWYVPASGSISPVDVSGNINRAAGNKGQNDGNGNRSVIHLNQWNSQYMDCVGITPYIWVSTPSRFGYTLTGWSTSGTTKSVQTLWGNYALNVGAYSGSGTPHQTNISMTANWRANTYYVYYNANGGWSAPGTQSFTFNSGARISSSVPVRTGYTFAGWDYAGNHFNPGQSIPSGWGSFTLTAKWNINSYYLDVNGMLDGVSNGGLAHYGTFDVNINGRLVANDVTDYYSSHPYGSSYSITDIRAKPGYQYNGVYSGALSGTIDTTKATSLNLSTSTYSNHIAHWAGGYKYGEGNNGSKNMKNIANTSFNAKYGSSFSMNTSRATIIPKGFYLENTFGTSSISGSWGTYAMGTNTTQKATSMSFEYYYQPYKYSIGYNLNGGAISSNPTSYTVLYAETIPNPSRWSYEFLGWTGSNGNTPQKNIRIDAGSTGNKSYTANWRSLKPTITTKYDRYYLEQESFTKESVLNGMKAIGGYKEDISDKIQLIGFENVKIGIKGDYKITAVVETDYGGKDSVDITLHISDKLYQEQPRAINKSTLSTLPYLSKWVGKAEVLKALLENEEIKDSFKINNK